MLSFETLLTITFFSLHHSSHCTLREMTVCDRSIFPIHGQSNEHCFFAIPLDQSIPTAFEIRGNKHRFIFDGARKVCAKFKAQVLRLTRAVESSSEIWNALESVVSSFRKATNRSTVGVFVDCLVEINPDGNRSYKCVDQKLASNSQQLFAVFIGGSNETIGYYRTQESIDPNSIGLICHMDPENPLEFEPITFPLASGRPDDSGANGGVHRRMSWIWGVCFLYLGVGIVMVWDWG